MTFFLVKFFSKFIDMCCMDTVLSLILLVSEKLKTPKVKVEAHYLRKLACSQQLFVTKYLRKISKANRRPFKIHNSTQTVMNTNFIFILYVLQSYPSKWAISVTEMHCPILAVLKLTQNNLLEINAKKDQHFTNPLVNVALKFYVES